MPLLLPRLRGFRVLQVRSEEHLQVVLVQKISARNELRTAKHKSLPAARYWLVSSRSPSAPEDPERSSDSMRSVAVCQRGCKGRMLLCCESNRKEAQKRCRQVVRGTLNAPLRLALTQKAWSGKRKRRARTNSKSRCNHKTPAVHLKLPVRCSVCSGTHRAISESVPPIALNRYRLTGHERSASLFVEFFGPIFCGPVCPFLLRSNHFGVYRPSHLWRPTLSAFRESRSHLVLFVKAQPLS